MCLPGSSYGPCRHHLGQDLWKGSGISFETAAMLGKRGKKRRRGLTILIGPYVYGAVGKIDTAVIQKVARCHRLGRAAEGPCQCGKAWRRACPGFDEGRQWCRNVIGNKRIKPVLPGKACAKPFQTGWHAVAPQHGCLELVHSRAEF